ncbi:MAG: endonuclease domain-containing protein [Clostridia bacterium]|nr:endonuclease domain-containing protein [Clostridia bacterium]MBR5191707.1 endonuclease domain-containing protein [Clostridia bacterium]
MTTTEKVRSLRKNATPWENKLWYEFLREYPIKFRRQQPIGQYIVDFYCSKARIIVEADGGGHFYDDKIKYDKERDLFLQSKGYTILHFTNLEIDKNFYEVCSVIDREVKKRV